jgi:hydroxymethylbilane synthase
LRRSAQLKALRSDLELLPLRGNVDTRLRKLESGEYDAIILAAAGLHRLGQSQRIRETIPISTMCPAAGQGALAVEIRAGDTATKNQIAFLDDSNARATTDCERSALNALGGGCQVPIGAYAEIINDKLRLTAVVARPDGQEILREQQDGDATHPEELGARVGRRLRERGADRILAEIYKSTAAAPQQP